MEEKKNLWDRKDEESFRAFAAFVAYRDMGVKRSIRGLARTLECHDAQLAKWSTIHLWQKRCTAWDDYLDRQSQNIQIDQCRVMKERQIALGLELQDLAGIGARALKEKVEKEVAAAGDGDYTISIKPEAISKLSDIGCRLERLNRDEAEQNIQILSDRNYDNFSLEEMEKFRELLEKSGGAN